MNELLPKQCGPDQMWLPGLHLDTEFPVPNDNELRALWNEYTSSDTAECLEGVYGVYQPKEDVKAIASIDLCEVLRETVQTFDDVVGISPTHRRSRYAVSGSWLDPEIIGEETSTSVQVSVLQALMSRGLIPADENAKEINQILSNWREQGVYNIANTSTLPGCEQGTIRYTLGRDFPGAFDALILPRNHDGLGTISKAKALGIFALEAGFDLDTTPFTHIDDSLHHIKGFQDTFSSHMLLRLVVPIHTENHTAPEEMHARTSLEAFQMADQHFRKMGVTE